MQTRAQKQQEYKPECKLNVSGKILNISRSEFEHLQMQDESLEKTRQKATEGQVKMCESGGEVRFIFKNKLLYREYVYTDQKKVYQLVVPTMC